MMNDWVRSKPWLALLGVISAGLSLLSVFGLLSALGVKAVPQVGLVPFLILGKCDYYSLLGSYRVGLFIERGSCIHTDDERWRFWVSPEPIWFLMLALNLSLLMLQLKSMYSFQASTWTSTQASILTFGVNRHSTERIYMWRGEVLLLMLSSIIGIINWETNGNFPENKRKPG